MENAGQVKVNEYVEQQLDYFANRLEEKLNADVMLIASPIYEMVADVVRQLMELCPSKRTCLAIVLDTPGGVIEVVERMVKTIRHHYEEVRVIVPNQAMSAGTVFAMSADAIMMDYFSCLGPIDPQVLKNGKLVPALSYIAQFEKMKERSKTGELTSAELSMMIEQVDIGELHAYEQAKELSVDLLKEWLAKYKFKDWEETKSRKIKVTQEMRQMRAEEIAVNLMEHNKWRSHGRPICMKVLQEDLNLKIDDFGTDKDLTKFIREYYGFLTDYMTKLGKAGALHVKTCCMML